MASNENRKVEGRKQHIQLKLGWSLNSLLHLCLCLDQVMQLWLNADIVTNFY